MQIRVPQRENSYESGCKVMRLEILRVANSLGEQCNKGGRSKQEENCIRSSY